MPSTADLVKQVTSDQILDVICAARCYLDFCFSRAEQYPSPDHYWLNRAGEIWVGVDAAAVMRLTARSL